MKWLKVTRSQVQILSETKKHYLILFICLSFGGHNYLVLLANWSWQVFCVSSRGVQKLAQIPRSFKKKTTKTLLHNFNRDVDKL